MECIKRNCNKNNNNINNFSLCTSFNTMIGFLPERHLIFRNEVRCCIIYILASFWTSFIREMAANDDTMDACLGHFGTCVPRRCHSCWYPFFALLLVNNASCYGINGRVETKHCRLIGCWRVILAVPIANRSEWACWDKHCRLIGCWRVYFRCILTLLSDLSINKKCIAISIRDRIIAQP